jgi:hypothetical protein
MISALQIGPVDELHNNPMDELHNNPMDELHNNPMDGTRLLVSTRHVFACTTHE